MEPVNPDELFCTTKEKTFSNQDKLPSLPVPELSHTLERYLDSVKPHVTPEEYRQTEFIVQQFASGVGKQLHNKLVEKASHSRNWLEKWWDDSAYLEGRYPVAPFVNFGGPGPYVYHSFPPQSGTQIYRAGILMHSSARFWNIVREERLKIDKDSKGGKMCMNQYHRAYSACRIPGVNKDYMSYNFMTENEGNGPRHVMVMYKERIFIFDIADEGFNILTPPEISQQLQKIKDLCNREPAGQGISALTALERTNWAQIRSRLLSLHPDNYHHLRTIETSIVAVSLDDAEPTNDTQMFAESLAGKATDKWYDKTLNYIFFENGTAGSNCDHTPVDAMVLVSSTYYNDLFVRKNKGRWTGSQEIRNLPEPKELIFHIDEVVRDHVIKAKRMYETTGKNMQITAEPFTKYGRKFLRGYKLHPDTHVQLALQCAYYKLYNKPAPTYETATTRRYYHARTETMRSCTVQALEWSKAMCNPNSSMQTRYSLYLRAANYHNKLMAEAQNNHGCDRHLLGLSLQAKEQGLPVPQIFTDPSFTKSGGGGNYVLSTSFVGYTTVYGGVAPMVENGYGTFYHIENDKIETVVTAWRSGKDTDSVMFSQEVHRCLAEMGDLIQQGHQAHAKL